MSPNACSPFELSPKPYLARAIDEAWRVWAKINLTHKTLEPKQLSARPSHERRQQFFQVSQVPEILGKRICQPNLPNTEECLCPVLFWGGSHQRSLLTWVWGFWSKEPYLWTHGPPAINGAELGEGSWLPLNFPVCVGLLCELHNHWQPRKKALWQRTLATDSPLYA